MKKKLRTMAMMLALALPIGLLAQGGLFTRGDTNGQSGAANKPMLFRNGEQTTVLSNQGFGNPIGGSDLTNQTFGAPLGNGLLVLLLTGAGYAAMKTNKKNDKHRKEK